MLDRWLAAPGIDAADSLSAKAGTFRTVLFLAVIAENLLIVHAHFVRGTGRALGFSVSTAILIACLAAVLRSARHARLATTLATLVVVVQYVAVFPNTANHHLLVAIAFATLSFFDLSRAEEQSAALSVLRWVVVIVFFYTGLQKLLYGLYFQGEFFAWEIAHGRRFARFFELILPAAEIERLQTIGRAAEGAGPYRLTSPLGLAISNVTWIAEMLFPLLLLVRKLRWVALAGCLMLMLGIQLGAREFVFGALFANYMMLFLPRDTNRKALPFFALFLAGLLVIRLLAPDIRFQ